MVKTILEKLQTIGRHDSIQGRYEDDKIILIFMDENDFSYDTKVIVKMPGGNVKVFEVVFDVVYLVKLGKWVTYLDTILDTLKSSSMTEEPVIEEIDDSVLFG